MDRCYIARRGNLEQIVSIDENLGNDRYECSYGVVSSHECVLYRSQLRELTEEERRLLMSGHYGSLPQMFYQSAPPGMPSMDEYKLSTISTLAASDVGSSKIIKEEVQSGNNGSGE